MDKDKLTKEFYAQIKYPGPNSLITYQWAQRLKPYIPSKEFLLLDAGCGAGRHTAGFLDLYPNCNAICLDISKPSLELAEALFKEKGFSNRVKILNQSFLNEISVDNLADCAISIGALHHSTDIIKSICNIKNALKPGGILGVMLYSKKSHYKRYMLKEAISILGLNKDLESAKVAVESFNKKYGSFFDKTIRTIYQDIRDNVSRKVKQILKISSYGNPTHISVSDAMFADAYLAPVDNAYDTFEVKEILEKANLEVLEFITLGNINKKHLPDTWVNSWEKLGFWEKVRVMELIDPLPRSWSIICKKKG